MPAGARLARSPDRAPGVSQAVLGEIANPFLDGRHGLVRVAQSVGHVPDGGAGVADEIGEGGDAALLEDIERTGGVGDVCPRGHHTGLQSSRAGLVDDADARAGDQNVRFDGEQVRGRPDLDAQVLDKAVTVLFAQLEQRVHIETLRTPDAPVDGGESDEPGAAHGHLDRGGASDLAEAFDGHRASFQTAERRIGRGRNSEPGEKSIERHAHVVGVHQVGLVGAGQ